MSQTSNTTSVETSKGTFTLNETVRYTPNGASWYDGKVRGFGINRNGTRTLTIEFMMKGGAHYFDTAIVSQVEKV